MDHLPASLAISETKRYFCHACRTEVRITSRFTCVQCCGGFVEEIATGSSANIPRLLRLLQRREEHNVSYNNNDNNNNNSPTNLSDSEEFFESTSSMVDNNIDLGSETAPTAEGLPYGSGRTDNFRSVVMNVLMDVLDLLGSVNNTANAEPSASTAHDTPNTSRHGILFDNFRSRLRDMVVARHLSVSSRESNNQNPLNAFLDLAFGSTSSGLSANVNFGNQTFVMGNPNNSNYVRQDDDLTNLLMNTLNRLLPTISRPLTNDRLAQIPKVKVTAEDLANQDMCAICWDEFKLKESVRKLPCSHFFHEACVFPWLKLHRTCPLCRSCLSNDVCCGNCCMDESLSGETSENTESSSVDMTDFSSDDGTSPDVTNTMGNSSMPDNMN